MHVLFETQGDKFMWLNRPIPQGGYRPDVYCSTNIIGYTGALHLNPTVYFLSETHYGHITQSHDSSWNIGREIVGERTPLPGYHYEIKNVLKNGIEIAGEYIVSDDGTSSINGHISRSKFIDCRRAGMNTFALLSQAIWRFHAVKTGEPRGNKYTYG